MRIVILNTAEDDLREGHQFYESQAVGLGAYFLDTLYADIDTLGYLAGLHRVVLGYHRLLSKRFPFAVYYRVQDNIVTVFAILDCRRSPNWIRKKLR